MVENQLLSRRLFAKTIASTAIAASFVPSVLAEKTHKSFQKTNHQKFKLNYLLSSAMYGTTALPQILPQVAKTGATAIDIWPRPHGNQYEQITKMGPDAFRDLLALHKVKFGAISCYKFGPFGLQKQMAIASKLKAKETIFVCGGSGPKGLAGSELKAAVKKFAEKMKPHIEAAEKYQAVIAVENHGNNLIDSPDSCKWLIEFTNSKRLGIAVAPHHLEPLGHNAKQISQFIVDLGKSVSLFYAQQHGNGSSKKMPKEQELLQMPGRGKLDFKPLVQALKKIQYTGYTEIFMHPTPRGVPILATPDLITQEINRSRKYLDGCCS